MKIAVIGGGAAGFFAAIQVKYNYPHSHVTIFEKTNKLLAKVKISGGGRCNVTNACTSISELCKAYPRGGKQLKKSFQEFKTTDTVNWFEKRGVPLKAEADGRVFPRSNNSQSILDCLLNEVQKLGIHIQTKSTIQNIEKGKDQLILQLKGEPTSSFFFDNVIVASGGSPKREGLMWLERLGHTIENPVPSLFTFNMPKESIKSLMGITVPNVQTSIQGSKLKANGPLLITHWGMSGPAILKLSAYGARELNSRNYCFNLQVNWSNLQNKEEARNVLHQLIQSNPLKKVSSVKPFQIPTRLWLFLLDRAQIEAARRFGDLGKKLTNKLWSLLTNDVYEVSGKTTFKEEFVTCGGVSLDSINMNTMESQVCKNLYFAGEVMDIDAITGGYNFQAAWTTGFIAGKLE